MSPGLKIDNIDVIILKALLQEPRTSFAKIAKDCGMSTPSIFNRFNLMKKSGIINGSIMQISPKSMGYDLVALVNIEVAPKEKEAVLNFLKTQNIAIYSPLLAGRSNILGFVIAKNADDLAHIVKEIKKNPLIRFVFTEIWVNTTNTDHPENLVINTISNSSSRNEMPPNKKNMTHAFIAKKNQINHEESRKKPKRDHQIDDIDLSMIKILTNDARISFRRIAEKLDISINNVIKRYKELRNNCFFFSSITLNLTKLGYVGTGVMAIKVGDSHDVKEVFDKILVVSNVIVAIRLFGDFDILAISPFRVLEDLDRVNQIISNISGVYEIKLMIDKPYLKWPLNMVSDLIIENL